MAEQRTKVGPAYYDGWQKQVADLREENARLRAVAEAAILVLERYCGTGAIGSEPYFANVAVNTLRAALAQKGDATP